MEVASEWWAEEKEVAGASGATWKGEAGEHKLPNNPDTFQ